MKYCKKCERGFITELEHDSVMIFCSNALCDYNRRKESGLQFFVGGGELQ